VLSGFWAIIAWSLVYQLLRWSIFSGILAGLIVFAVSYRINETHRECKEEK
jgi:hypothetical protein